MKLTPIKVSLIDSFIQFHRSIIDTETITTHHVNQYTEEEVNHLSDEEQDFYLSGQDTYTTTETISHPMLPLYISSEPTYNANSYLAAQFLVNYGKTGGKWPYKVLGFTGIAASSTGLHVSGFGPSVSQSNTMIHLLFNF